MSIFKVTVEKTYHIDVFVMAEDEQCAEAAVQYQIDRQQFNVEDDVYPQTDFFTQEIKLLHQNNNAPKNLKEEIQSYGIVIAKTNTIENNIKTVEMEFEKEQKAFEKAKKEKWLQENHLEFNFK